MYYSDRLFNCLSSCKLVHSVHLNQTRGVGEYGSLSKGNQSFFTQAFQLFRLRHTLSVLRLFTNLFYHPLITIFFVLFIVCYYFDFFDFIAATWCRPHSYSYPWVVVSSGAYLGGKVEKCETNSAVLKRG